jgi:hypothetical protein
VAGIVISSLSTVYVQVPVAAVVNGAAYNPTGDTIQMAFPANSANPETWYDAAWTDGPGSGAYLAQCLVGPASSPLVNLGTGTYGIWVQITDNPEIPVINCGVLVIQ